MITYVDSPAKTEKKGDEDDSEESVVEVKVEEKIDEGEEINIAATKKETVSMYLNQKRKEKTNWIFVS